MQLPPAFSLPHDERIGKAVELAYDRDFSHIPYVKELSVKTCMCARLTYFSCSVLSHERRPLGYIDVAALKTQWEAGEASPVNT